MRRVCRAREFRGGRKQETISMDKEDGISSSTHSEKGDDI